MLTTFWHRKVNPWPMIARDIDEIFNSLPMPAREPWEYDRVALSPAYDIDETDDHYLLSFDIPGVSRDDLNIEFTGNRLVIFGERKSEGKSGSRRYGRFQQAFTLPEGTTVEGIEAECRDGVLKLSIQKPAAVRPRKIKIGDGTAAKAGGFLKTLIGEKPVRETGDVRVPVEKPREAIAVAN